MFAVFFVFLISACVNISGTTKAGISFVEKGNEDILVRAELSQSELKPGLSTNLRFTVQNKQNYDLKNFELSVYDLCDFTCNKQTLWTEETIRVNRTKDFTLNCKAPEVESERTCSIKFKSSYSGELHQSHDVFVISESEFATGKTKVSPTSSSTESPLKISATWSDPQPFVNGDSAILYLDYEYSGDGIIQKLAGKSDDNVGDVNFTVGKNLEVIKNETTDRCIDFSESDGVFVLNKDLAFLGKKAKRSTCAFIATARQPIDSGRLVINARFKYNLDSSIPITVQPRKSI